MCCFALMLYFQNFLAPPLSISISQGQYQSVRVSIGQLGLILVSRGQYWSVGVKIGQLGSKLVSWGQYWSVGINICQLGSISVRHSQYWSGAVKHRKTFLENHQTNNFGYQKWGFSICKNKLFQMFTF